MGLGRMRLLILAELRRHPLLHAAAALVVALLVAAVIVLRATSAHADRTVHDAAHALGKNMLVVPAVADRAAAYAHRHHEGLPESHVGALRASSVAVHIRSLEARLYGELELDGRPMKLVGVEDRWPELPGAIPAAVGAAAARRLGLGTGSTVPVGDRSLQVVAVVPAAPDGLDDAVLVPLRAAQELLGRRGEISALRLGGCWCSIDVASLGSEIERILPGTRAITVAGTLAAQQGSIAVVRRYGVLLQGGGALVAAALALLIASARGRQRAGELALLSAIGAPPRQLAASFALQAALDGSAGALAGNLIALAVTPWATSKLLGSAASPSLDLLLTSVVAAGVLCATAALVPGILAAGRDPVVVLRESHA
jgi:putative ABC transport system permease protein